jgi:hypothetical protein
MMESGLLPSIKDLTRLSMLELAQLSAATNVQRNIAERKRYEKE